jgi:hypothetical protein
MPARTVYDAPGETARSSSSARRCKSSLSRRTSSSACRRALISGRHSESRSLGLVHPARSCLPRQSTPPLRRMFSLTFCSDALGSTHPISPGENRSDQRRHRTILLSAAHAASGIVAGMRLRPRASGCVAIMVEELLWPHSDLQSSAFNYPAWANWILGHGHLHSVVADNPNYYSMALIRFKAGQGGGTYLGTKRPVPMEGIGLRCHVALFSIRCGEQRPRYGWPWHRGLPHPVSRSCGQTPTQPTRRQR